MGVLWRCLASDPIHVPVSSLPPGSITTSQSICAFPTCRQSCLGPPAAFRRTLS